MLFSVAALLLVPWLCAVRDAAWRFGRIIAMVNRDFLLHSQPLPKCLWLILWCLYISSRPLSASETAPPSLSDLELLLNASTTSCSTMNSSWQCRELEPSESAVDMVSRRNTLICPLDTICILNCRAAESCSALDVVAEANSTLLIGCMHTGSCRDLSISADLAHYVHVEGNDNHSISFSAIQCPVENHLGASNCVVHGSCTDFAGRDHCTDFSVSALLMISYLAIYSDHAARDVEVSCDERTTVCIGGTSFISCHRGQSSIPQLCHLWYDGARCQFGCRGDPHDQYGGDHDSNEDGQCRPRLDVDADCRSHSVATSNVTETSTALEDQYTDEDFVDAATSVLGLNRTTLVTAAGSLCLLCLCCVAGCGIRRRAAAAKERRKGQHIREDEMGNMVVIGEQHPEEEESAAAMRRKRKRYWQRADGAQSMRIEATSGRWQPQQSQSVGAGRPTHKGLSDQSTASGTFDRNESKRPSCSARSRSHHDGLEDEAAQKLASSKLGANTPLSNEMVKLAGISMTVPAEQDPDYQLALQLQQEQLINANHHQRSLKTALHRPTPSPNGLTPTVPHLVARVPTDSGGMAEDRSLRTEGNEDTAEKVLDLGGGFTFNVEPSSTRISRSRYSSVSASSDVLDPGRYLGVDAEDEY